MRTTCDDQGGDKHQVNNNIVYTSESDPAVVKQLNCKECPEKLEPISSTILVQCSGSMRCSTGITEVMVLNSVESSEFFLGFLCFSCFTTVRITFTCILYPQCISTCMLGSILEV